MKRVLLLASLWLLLPASAADLEQAITRTQEEIRTATGELSALLDRISEQRRRHVERRELLAEEVRTLREEVERHERARARTVEQSQSLVREIARLEDAHERVQAALTEYRRELDASLTNPEVEALQAQLALADAALRPSAPLPDAVRILLQTAEAARRPGVDLREGRVVLADGVERSGSILLVGPMLWFVSDAEAGVLVTRPDRALPVLLNPEAAAPFASVAAGGQALLPVDVSGGKAALASEGARPWIQRLRDGGITLIPLFVVALVSLGLSVWKALGLQGVRGHDPAAVLAVAAALRVGDKGAAESRAGTVPEPLATILRGGVEHAGAAREQLEEIMHERMLAVLPRLDRHLGTLAVLAGIAPLLGLLGTVTGMIHTFELITLFGSGNTRLMSGGISEALITTMLGLSIAIPTLLAHAFLSRRVRVIVSELEQAIAAFIHAVDQGDAA